jgi:hypothetical protein
MKPLHYALALATLGLASLPVAAQDNAISVGHFDATSETPPAPWQVVRFDEKVPPTHYRVMTWDGIAAIEARAEASMALLARPLDVDLTRTPVLCWRWRVDAPLVNADMATKAGDDYAARVYVTFSLPDEAMDFSTRFKLGLARGLFGQDVPDAAINYVWDNRYPVGTERPNAHTDRNRMLVLRSGPDEAGAWVTERRDVVLDVARAYGTEAAQAIQLALAADTDNTGESARSGFADLHFVARDAACGFAPT